MTFHARDPQRKIRGSGQPDDETAGDQPITEPEAATAQTEPDLAAAPASDVPGTAAAPRPHDAQSKFGAAWTSAPFSPPVASPAPPAPIGPAPTPATHAAPLVPSSPLSAAPSLPARRLPARPLAPTPTPPAARPTPPPASFDDDLETGKAARPRPTFRELIGRITPAMAILTIGSVGSALFLLFAMTSHTTPIGVLMSAGLVTALVFALDTVILSAATYRESRTGEAGRALTLALLGGISAVICALALAGTLILLLVLNS